MSRYTSKLQSIQEANQRLERRILNEQESTDPNDWYKTHHLEPKIKEGFKEVDKVSLSDGKYIGKGSGSGFDINDSENNFTGYHIITSKVIRGPESNDAVTIINGEVSSRTWGNTIKYILFKDVGYTPKKVEEQAGSADFAQNKGKKPPTDTNFA
jgi:hypothetical protein